MLTVGPGRVVAGTRVEARELVAVDGSRVRVPASVRFVHLQFRRFAGCPVCNLHLRAFARRHAELDALGVQEVVVFHSTVRELRPQVAGWPFAVVADPDQELYIAFGVESSPRALLHPRAWPAIARGIANSLVDVVRGRRPAPPLNPRGGRYGLPADVLLAPDGLVVAAKYGAHVDDNWSVDDVLALVPEE
jgi:peroxiredoxin